MHIYSTDSFSSNSPHSSPSELNSFFSSSFKEMSSPSSFKKLRVALVGARGYSGMELGRCLLRHPALSSLTLILNETAIDVKTWIPEAQYYSHCLSSLTTKQFMASLENFDIVFLATPAEGSLSLVPQVISTSLKIIDLSGAFRLNNSEDYKKWYGFEHHHPKLLKQAHYGLVPFHTHKDPKNISLIANPGCYATAVQMALIPLLKSSLLNLETIVIDAKSGTTGAGKKASEVQLFAEVEGDCQAYRIGKHQHFPEIIQYLTQFSKISTEIETLDPIFSTTLLPIRRGIVASIYARLNTNVTPHDLEKAYATEYETYPLVRVSSAQQPEASYLLSLRSVVGSARTHITYSVEGTKLQIYSNIDNLMKGAASQAIENMNYLYQWPLHTGLTHLEGLI